MSNTLSKQFFAFVHSFQDAFDRLMENVSSDTSNFNHVAAFPDCPVMWSLDDETPDAALAKAPQAPKGDERSQQAIPAANSVQYHYHYYPLSGLTSTLATIGAVSATSVFLMLAWVGLVHVRSLLVPTSALEEGQVQYGLNITNTEANSYTEASS